MFHTFPKGGGEVTLLHAPRLWMEIIGGSILGYLVEGRTVLVATKRGSYSRWEMQMRSYWKTQKREQRYWKPGPRARKAEDSGRRAFEPSPLKCPCSLPLLWDFYSCFIFSFRPVLFFFNVTPFWFHLFPTDFTFQNEQCPYYFHLPLCSFAVVAYFMGPQFKVEHYCPW